MVSLRDQLVLRAAAWPSPHVRRIGPLAGNVCDAMDAAGVVYRQRMHSDGVIPYKGQLHIGAGDKFFGRFDHPDRKTRKKSRLTIYQVAPGSSIAAAQLQPPVYEFYDVGDVVAFNWASLR